MKAITSAWQHRQLVFEMTRREILARYQGSWLGLFWTLLTPILLLFVYMFVFGVVFKARWPEINGVTPNFSSLLFCGIIVHMFFAEVLSAASSLVLDQANYVKKVVFPLDILSWISLGEAAFHFLVAVLVLFGVVIVSGGGLSWTVLYVPLLMLIFMVHLLGMSWFVSACGVYIRDVKYVAGFMVTAMVFLSPVFYPASAVPDSFAMVMNANPLTFYIEAFRSAVVLGQPVPLAELAWAMVLALLSFAVGFWFFERVKKGFADVL
jgi:lipopolysaccharide transport system permease protein